MTKNVKMTKNINKIKIEKNSSEYTDDSPFTLLDILLIVSRYIQIIFYTPIIICTITVVHLVFFAQPIYLSTSKIMSSNSGANGGMSQAAGIAAQFGININSNQTEPNWVYSEIIKSRTLAKSILNQKFNTEEFGLQKSLLQILTYGNKKPKFGKDTLEIIAINKLLKMVDVIEDVRTSIFTVKVSASEPGLATEINKELILGLDAYQRKYNKSITSETRQFIEDRIIDTEKELKNAEEVLKTFMVQNRRIENSPTLQLEQQRLAREVDVLVGVFTTLKQQYETTKIEEVKESDYVVVIDPPEIPLTRDKPRKVTSVIFAAIIGIGLGIVIAFIQNFINNSAKEEKEKINTAKRLFLTNLSKMFLFKFKTHK